MKLLLERYVLFLTLFLYGIPIVAQKVFTFTRVIDTLSLSCDEAKMAKLDYQNAIMQYDNYKKSFLPSLSLSLQPVSFNHSLRLLQNYVDGSYSYVEDYANTSSIGVSVKQKVGITGGELYVNSSLNYLRDFSENRNNFYTTPFSIGYSQPFWGSRKLYKYTKQINEKTFQNASQLYYAKLAAIQNKVAGMFFTAQLALERKIFSRQLMERNDSLLKVSKVRLDNGYITEYDYKQLELRAANLSYSCEEAANAYETALQQLSIYLGVRVEFIVEQTATNLPLILDSQTVLSFTRNNNPYYQQKEIEMLSAQQELYQAKLSAKVNGSFTVSIGTNNYANTFIAAYKRSNYSEAVSVGVTIPIFQWGINKNKVQIAENMYQSKQIAMSNKTASYEQEILNDIMTYNHNIKLFYASMKAKELAAEQIRLAMLRYELGKISVYELREAQQQQDTAMLRYFESLQQVYINYFRLREDAVYDFQHEQSLSDRYKLYNK